MLLACPSCQRLYDVSAFEAGARIRCHCGHCSTCGGRLASAARAPTRGRSILIGTLVDALLRGF